MLQSAFPLHPESKCPLSPIFLQHKQPHPSFLTSFLLVHNFHEIMITFFAFSCSHLSIMTTNRNKSRKEFNRTNWFSGIRIDISQISQALWQVQNEWPEDSNFDLHSSQQPSNKTILITKLSFVGRIFLHALQVKWHIL